MWCWYFYCCIAFHGVAMLHVTLLRTFVLALVCYSLWNYLQLDFVYTVLVFLG